MKFTPQVEMLFGLFVLSVIIWIILIIYKSRLESQGQDKISLGTTERLKPEDAELLKKVDRMSKPLWAVGIITVLLLCATVAMWIYQGLLSS